MRSPAEMDVIQLDANVACHKRCSNCTRLVSHQTKKWEMSPAQAKMAIDSMQGWYKPGRVLGLIGGEVTLHSQFEEIARVFRENWNQEKPTRIGREPIKDFNAFAEERLYDRSSGRGLWTSLGAGFRRHFEAICDTFDHWNVNTHESEGLHQALLIHRDDYCAQTGMKSEDWERNRDRCWVQNLWSATINDKGAYPCEVMGAIDRFYFDGANAWPVEKDWWKRTPAEFGKMLDLCNYCALAQPGPATVDSLERDTISPKNRIQLELVNSPAVKKGRYDLYDGDNTRTVTSKDSYVNGPRVIDSGVTQKTTAIVVCVDFGPLLEHTLPHNAKQVDELVVVADRPFWKGPVPDKVRFVFSEACYENGAAFNKGAMLNAGLEKASNDWIIFTDADILLHPKLKEFISTNVLNPGCLYYTSRFDVDSATGELKPRASEDKEPNGYFQLWNRKAQTVRDRARVMSENFCSAGGIDSWFMQQWPADKQVYLPEMAVAHIPHGGSLWNGGLAGQRWRQIGVLGIDGFSKIRDFPKEGKQRLRLTDTVHGESVDIEVDFNSEEAMIPGSVFRIARSVVFNGKDIGARHVHVACLTE